MSYKSESEVGSILPEATHHTSPVDGEIDLRELFGVMWKRKWFICASTLIFAVAFLIYAVMKPDIYQSQALLAPSEDMKGGGISKMAGQLGGLASLAGINMGATAGGDKVAVAIAVMRSRSFIGNFLERYSALPDLMAVDSWSARENKIQYDRKVYMADEGVWVRNVAFPFEAEPSR